MGMRKPKAVVLGPANEALFPGRQKELSGERGLWVKDAEGARIILDAETP